MQIVLREDIEHLGRSGELVRVKPGYARNYLLPHGLAAIATPGNVAQIEHETAVAVARATKLRASAEERRAEIEKVSVTIEAKAGGNNKLFGSVGTKDIAAALAAQGVEVDRKKITLADPIKELGEYEVTLKLGFDVNATIKVSVTGGEE